MCMLFQCEKHGLSKLFASDVKFTPICGVAILRIFKNAESVNLFLVFDLISFTIENVVSQKHALPTIEHTFKSHFLRSGKHFIDSNVHKSASDASVVLRNESHWRSRDSNCSSAGWHFTMRLHGLLKSSTYERKISNSWNRRSSSEINCSVPSVFLLKIKPSFLDSCLQLRK